MKYMPFVLFVLGNALSILGSLLLMWQVWRAG